MAALAARAEADALAPAGFWARLGAYLVDGLMMYGVFLLVAAVVARPLGWKDPDLQSFKKLSDLEPYLVMLCQQVLVRYLLQMLYEVPMTVRYGATLGKMLVGAQVMMMDGSPLGWRAALGRFLGKLVSETVCYIGYLMAAFRADKRALHDLMAGTRVVRRPRRDE